MIRASVFALWIGCGATGAPTPADVSVPPAEPEPEVELPDTEPESEPEPAAPAFEGRVLPIDDVTRVSMEGVTMHPGCPVPMADLARLDVSHHTLDGGITTGTLIVAADVADDLLGVFEALFDAGFVIERMEPAWVYGGSDDASMAVDNTSAFNCRQVTGGTGYSRHSYGDAIDINPLRNPYVRGNTVLPPAGRDYLERDGSVPGVIVEDGPVVAAFDAIGWGWGGRWSSLKDYQHFSRTGD